MPERKSFLLRIDRETLDAVQRWANDDLRSLNGQIEYILRRALQSNGRTSRSVPASETVQEKVQEKVRESGTEETDPTTNE